MGGTVIVLKNEDVTMALESFAKEYGITHLVLGRPGRKRWWSWKPRLHDRLISELEGVDIVIAEARPVLQRRAVSSKCPRERCLGLLY